MEHLGYLHILKPWERWWFKQHQWISIYFGNTINGNIFDQHQWDKSTIFNGKVLVYQGVTSKITKFSQKFGSWSLSKNKIWLFWGIDVAKVCTVCKFQRHPDYHQNVVFSQYHISLLTIGILWHWRNIVVEHFSIIIFACCVWSNVISNWFSIEVTKHIRRMRWTQKTNHTRSGLSYSVYPYTILYPFFGKMTPQCLAIGMGHHCVFHMNWNVSRYIIYDFYL